MKKYLVFVGVVLLAVGAHAATLEVNTTAAIEGTYGLEVLFDGTTEIAYVMDDSPNNEPIYRVLFKLTLPGTFDFELGFPQATSDLRQRAYAMLFSVKDIDQPPGNARLHLHVHLKRFGADLYQLFARAYDPTNPWAAADGFVYRDHLGGAMEVNLPVKGGPGYPVIVLVEYQAESAPGAVDGIFTLKRANNFDPSIFLGKSNTEMRNNDKDVDEAYLGAPGGVDTGTVGSYYMDSFESYRTLTP
jgi:hypothetical protein